MNVLITYDISSKHSEVKNGMKAIKYLDYWNAENQIFYLPNTSLWKNATDITPASVLADFKKVVEDLNAKIMVAKDKIKIERCVTVNFTGWDGVKGDKHVEK